MMALVISPEKPILVFREETNVLFGRHHFCVGRPIITILRFVDFAGTASIVR